MSDENKDKGMTFFDCHKSDRYDLDEIAKHMSMAIVHDMKDARGTVVFGGHMFDIVYTGKMEAIHARR